MRRRIAATILLATLVLGSRVAIATQDPDWQFQYGPQQIYAPEAWTVTRGDGVTIAIVDTGVQLDHPDLRDKLVQGYDFADDDTDPTDESGHGTHVAGIAGAATDNGIGIAGVAPDAKLMPIRVPLVGSEGDANIAQAILAIENAIRYAVDNGADVINLSIGEEANLTPQGFDSVSNACRDAFTSGALCIAAAGNSGRSKPSGYAHDFPGIVVAANDRNRDVATFSQNADTQWAVTAPGVAVHSTWLESGYQMNQGTSMAAPHVAGVAGLLFAQGRTVQEVIDRIVQTATPLNDGGGMSGAGLVNAAAAVGADFTPASPPTTAAAAATTTVPAASGSGPGRGASTTTTAPIPVELEEADVEPDEGAFLGDNSEDFDAALGATEEAEPISYSDGFTLPFTVAVLGFVAILSALGFVGRRIVLRRGVGQI